ncbi:MAG: hypothetical protein LUF92_03710 [Clostridiales bacterium]|nr:hypothetical protein [Clostridiales bacterium]
MTLKEECIDMIEMITESLVEEDSYDESEFSIEVDDYKNMCTLYGEDTIYIDSVENDNCDECETGCYDCRYHRWAKIDVSFCHYGSFQKNYVFTGKKEKTIVGVKYIRNRKQLLKEMKNIKKELERSKNWWANFGEKYLDCMNYAHEFAEQIKNEWFLGYDANKNQIFYMVNTDILPIVLHVDFLNDQDFKNEKYTSGNFISQDKQNIINIYYCVDEEDSVKSTIRHEILHYMLYVADLKYDDDCAIFHYLCGMYNANAYKEMPEEEKVLYGKIMSAIYRLPTMLKEDYRMSAICSMLIAIGVKEDSMFYNLEAKEINIRLLNFLIDGVEDNEKVFLNNNII